MKRFISTAAVAVIIFLPMVREGAVHMSQEQATRLYQQGQLQVVRMYEDGSGFFRWQGKLYGGCAIPDWGCGD